MKFLAGIADIATAHGRSREGAWIEIDFVNIHPNTSARRSREGAWIEIA